MDIISQWRKRVLNPEIIKPSQGVDKNALAIQGKRRIGALGMGLWTGYLAYVYGSLAVWNQAFKSPCSSVARGQRCFCWSANKWRLIL